MRTFPRTLLSTSSTQPCIPTKDGEENTSEKPLTAAISSPGYIRRPSQTPSGIAPDGQV